MKSILKAALVGTLAAAAVFFVPFLPFLLMFLLVFAFLSRRWWGWTRAPRFAAAHGWGRQHRWADQPAQPVSIDGRVWQRAAAHSSAAHDVQVG